MFGILKFIWLVGKSFVNLLNIDRNALKHIPNETKYLAMIMLSCFWCVTFGLYFSEFNNIAYNMGGHVLLITMCFVTWWTFRNYQRQSAPYKYRGQDFLRMPDRSSRCDELTDEQRIELSKRI